MTESNFYELSGQVTAGVVAMFWDKHEGKGNHEIEALFTTYLAQQTRRDILNDYLQWEGIIGYGDAIADFCGLD